MAATTQAADNEHGIGDTVEIAFAAVAGRTTERKSWEVEIEEKTGRILYMSPPFESDLTLVLDPEGDLWARDEDGSDGLYGRHTQVEGEIWEQER